MTTYLMRHAPTSYSADYKVNGDPAVDVPLTEDGAAKCREIGSTLPLGSLSECATSTFARCRRTAELVTGGSVPVRPDPRLNELDYGEFEGRDFLTYATWLAGHGPRVRPLGARESQAEGIVRMLTALRDHARGPGSRIIVAHGLLVSVVQWGLSHPSEVLTEVFLPSVECCPPFPVDDQALRLLCDQLIRDLRQAASGDREWHVDLDVFPRESGAALASVVARAPQTSQTTTQGNRYDA